MSEIKNLDYLLPSTQKTLQKLVHDADFLKDYAFVGGSAVALHLKHRKSEDLDFFTWDGAFYQPLDMQKQWGDWEKVQLLTQSDTQMDALLNHVKVTFFNAGWEFLKPAQASAFNLTSLPLLAAMKVHTLFLRAKYRDYYDLYFIVRELGVEQVYENAKYILKDLTQKLFFSALTYIDDVEDDNIEHLEPAEIITKQEIRAYFEAEIKRFLLKGK